MEPVLNTPRQTSSILLSLYFRIFDEESTVIRTLNLKNVEVRLLQFMQRRDDSVKSKLDISKLTAIIIKRSRTEDRPIHQVR